MKVISDDAPASRGGPDSIKYPTLGTIKNNPRRCFRWSFTRGTTGHCIMRMYIVTWSSWRKLNKHTHTHIYIYISVNCWYKNQIMNNILHILFRFHGKYTPKMFCKINELQICTVIVTTEYYMHILLIWHKRHLMYAISRNNENMKIICHEFILSSITLCDSFHKKLRQNRSRMCLEPKTLVWGSQT